MGGTPPAAPPISDPHFQGGFAGAPFQQNLDLETPKMDILKLRRYKPHNYKGEGYPTYATHITTPGGSLNDPYFLAAQQLIYRVLWDMRSGTAQFPFTAFVAPHITEEQRSVLAAAGAIVRELDPIEWHPDKDTQGRWQYNFARLNLWRQTDFSKILYLDADAFPVQKLDSLLETPTRSCKRDLLPLEDQASGEEICPYTFMAAQQNLFAEAADVMELNTGVMIIQPNLAMHRRLTRELTTNKNWDTSMADKAFLSEMFKPSGPFPFAQLARDYNGFFPGPLDEGKFKVVHEKLWVETQESAPWTKGMFREKHAEMKAFYENPAFQQIRLTDGERVY
ncbi:glycosyltransferase family 8 protein [Cercospora zeae-maydis SCOH1-5]|uniref:Glycosyltransferase family 8 protein n=1 Tax=Cercospora zeae-maydis SCOH1-5 TaxID=717836 RepID=A0A6A6F489_9PEZI|nr:glycosyltransferase family 8 protein [Cercospora zeae-maydis SCOH1-5]